MRARRSLPNHAFHPTGVPAAGERGRAADLGGRAPAAEAEHAPCRPVYPEERSQINGKMG